jgi:transposase
MLDPLPLTTDEIGTLEACRLHAPHPRQRRRAQAVLGQLAAFYAVRYATVHAGIHAWQQQGLAGLAEGKRAGRPLKLPAEAPKK